MKEVVFLMLGYTDLSLFLTRFLSSVTQLRPTDFSFRQAFFVRWGAGGKRGISCQQTAIRGWSAFIRLSHD